MGGKQSKGPQSSGSVSSMPTPEEEFLIALQKYAFRAEGYHRDLSYKKRMPEPKPPPPPPSPIEALSTEDLCTFVHGCLCEIYGEDVSIADEVAGKFRAQLIDGGRVKHLQPRDWKALCPYIGPRTYLVDRVKNYGAAPVKPPQPPAPQPEKPSGPPLKEHPIKSLHFGGNGLSGAAPQRDDDAMTDVSSASPVSPAVGEFPNPATQDQHTKTAVPSQTKQQPSQGGAKGQNEPSKANGGAGTQPERRPKPKAGQLSWRKMLAHRSRYSNHRLIDCPWQPDVSRAWIVQLWQVFQFEIMRILFFAFIIRKFGLRLRQVPYFAVPIMSTWVCLYYQWYVDFAPPLYTTIVVFPLSFAMNAAYQRREQALSILASIKASASALYLFSECWTTTQAELPETFVAETSHMIRATFRNFGHYLTAISEADRETLLSNIYLQYSDLFYQVDMFRLSGVGPPLVTVPFNNTINLILGFERLRVFSDYRTPCTIRSYCTTCIGVLAFCMGPYFANIANKWGLVYGYMLCVVFFWLLMCMSNIQAMLENPYVTFGRGNAEDDINLVPLMGVAALKKKKHRKRYCKAADEPK